MSSILNIYGFFALAAGVRRPTPRPPSGSVYHCYYTTAIQTASGTTIPAEIRVYSPPSDIPLRDDTVIFLVGKLQLRVDLPALIDALHLYPVPGDVSDESYQDHVPDMPFPFIYGIGTVHAKHETLADGKSRGFAVGLSERVRDVQSSSSLLCILDASPRWANVPAPSPQSLIYFLGTATSVRDDGLLAISLSSLLFNLSPSQSPAPETPVKRRKFNAFATLAPSPSSGTPSSASEPSPVHPPPLSAGASSPGPLNTTTSISPSLPSDSTIFPITPLQEPSSPLTPPPADMTGPSLPLTPTPTVSSAKARGKRKMAVP
ncbi:hypothetical protein BN946_scf184845.g62 [Trametes cinnabarina]|uniref:Uncharacterized protein n=1 Tax=Pycnoporus cinnabarinus TaxID=5643 RepID=A0A060S9M0_PYCCI|nr:hypothetical protein BN946_scf184845.g62 [Trametes cinnabarina]